MLAVIMAIGISVPAFAEGAETVDVDNTFDNFTPGPGKQAPDNWYDPYCYDEEGHITDACLTVFKRENAFYCKEYKKIFTNKRDGMTSEGVPYFPYRTLTTLINIDTGKPFDDESIVVYCPYCGKMKNGIDGFQDFHDEVDGVELGSYCTLCGGFNASYGVNSNSKMHCYHCYEDYLPAKYYRFLTEEQRNSDYAFIFTETASNYGDGVDGNVEDLKVNRSGYVEDWKPGSGENKKLTFWEKIAAFFNNIAKFFNSIFNAIAGIFK